MEDHITIGAFYQCYKQPKSLLRALGSFRQYYPNSTVVLVSDGGGYDYTKVAEHFNCHYSRLSIQGGQQESTLFSDQQHIVDWVMRLVDAARIMTEEYVLLLEDDVVVMNTVISPLLFDINGANTKEYIGPAIEKYLKDHGKKGPGKHGKFYYGGCGGSLFKRTFILEQFSDPSVVREIIDQFETHREGRHKQIYSTDYWISLLTYWAGGTVGTYQGFCETWYRTYWLRRHVYKNIEVLHQAKDLYNKPLDKDEQDILGELSV